MLCRYGVDLSVREALETPLFMAAQSDRIAALNALLEGGADYLSLVSIF